MSNKNKQALMNVSFFEKLNRKKEKHIWKGLGKLFKLF